MPPGVSGYRYTGTTVRTTVGAPGVTAVGPGTVGPGAVGLPSTRGKSHVGSVVTSTVDLNPTEYDVDELHEVAGTGLAGAVPDPDGAGGFVWVTSPATDDGSGELRVDAGDPTPEQCEQLLRVGGLDPEALGDRPYLNDIPDGEAARATVRDWLEHLVTTGGRDDALAALSRYRTLGWLDDDVEDELREHVTAASDQLDEGDGTLDVADHLLSFGYLIRVLAARDRS